MTIRRHRRFATWLACFWLIGGTALGDAAEHEQPAHVQAMLGVLTARIVEAADRWRSFDSENVQQLVEATLSGYRRSARSADAAAEFARLRDHLRRIDSEADKAADLSALRSARTSYLADLPAEESASNQFGALAAQIAYNAQTIRDPSADRVLRSELPAVCEHVPAQYQHSCGELAGVPPNDLGEVSTLATTLVSRLMSADGASR